jgi:hypothetical protein
MSRSGRLHRILMQLYQPSGQDLKGNARLGSSGHGEGTEEECVPAQSAGSHDVRDGKGVQPNYAAACNLVEQGS